MKNTVIKITTKKDYDAVMRKLEEMGYKKGYGVSWVNNLPGINKITKKNFSLCLYPDDGRWFFSGGYSWYKKEYPHYHFTTAKRFLKEEPEIFSANGVDKTATYTNYHTGRIKSDTELIELLKIIMEDYRTYEPITNHALGIYAKITIFIDQLEQKSTTTSTLTAGCDICELDFTDPNLYHEYMKAHTTPKPKKIEKLPTNDVDLQTSERLKTNEIIDAINEMRGSR